jgi:hypothetical protein
MSRSQIACAIDAGTTTIVRVKSSGTSGCALTMCQSLRGGLEAVTGPKSNKYASKLSAMLSKWPDEPVALAFSPSEILTLPAWFPATATPDERESLGRLEAGYFVRNIDEWLWHILPVEETGDRPLELERQMLMFYPSEPARFVEEALQTRNRVNMSGLHIEPLVRLSVGLSEPMAVLELEERYAAFFVSVNGKARYFRYWPVRNGSERDYFAIAELTGAEDAGSSKIRVTGSAADPASLKRIASATSRVLEPLGIPQGVTLEGKAKGCTASTGVVRAISMAMMTLTLPPGSSPGQ